MDVQETIDKQEFECMACSGTGLYKGFAEPEGTAVICNRCCGTGKATHGKTLFTNRKPKPGITRVMADGGLWMMRSGNEKTISISEFYRLVPSKKVMAQKIFAMIYTVKD